MARMTKKQKAARGRRNKFTGVRVLPALEAFVQTSIWTEAAFQVNPIQFLTGVTAGGYKPGADGSQTITLPELLGAGPGSIGGNFTGTAGRYDNLANAVQTNIGGIQGLLMTGIKSAGVSIGFRLVSKMTRKARSGLNNQILKPLGVNSMVRV